MFNKILVAYDGSSSSRAAVQQAFELAEANNAQVTVLSVAPSVAPLAGLSGVSILGGHERVERSHGHTERAHW
jgi:nucleotide-binding universal stress UspA family protein